MLMKEYCQSTFVLKFVIFSTVFSFILVSHRQRFIVSNFWQALNRRLLYRLKNTRFGFIPAPTTVRGFIRLEPSDIVHSTDLFSMHEV
jgi:hypothetical protein